MHHHPPPPRGSVRITRWEAVWRAGKFFMWSSKFRTNHREVDFYLHTFPRSNCIMRPFSKWCWPEFKANPVQRKSDFIFTKCDHAKVILVSTAPFEILEKTSFWIPKDTFQSIKKDFTPLVLWRAPISVFQVGAACESEFYSKCRSFCLPTTTVIHSKSFELPSAESQCVFYISKSIIVCIECSTLKRLMCHFQTTTDKHFVHLEIWQEVAN